MKNPAPIQTMIANLEAQLESHQLQVIALSAAIDALSAELRAYEEGTPSWTQRKTDDDDVSRQAQELFEEALAEARAPGADLKDLPADDVERCPINTPHTHAVPFDESSPIIEPPF